MNARVSPESLPFAIPRLEDVSPLYAELHAKARTITREMGELGAKSQELILSLRDRQHQKSGSGRFSEFGQVRPTEQDARVADILGDIEPTPSEEATVESTIREINARIADLSAANRVLAERLSVERLKASSIVCKQVEPQFRAVMTDVVDKMVAAVEAAARYRAFAIAMNGSNVAWSSLDPMSQGVGGVADRGSPFDLWLTGAMKRGFGDLSRLEALR